jgi:hypothetical protein
MVVLFWIRYVQNGLSLTKLVQISDQLRLTWFNLVQIGSTWFKLVQIGSNQIKLVQTGIRLIIWFKSGKIGSNCFKSD